MGSREIPLRLSARAKLLVVFALITLGLLGGGVLAMRALLQRSLYQAARQEAGREAELVTKLSLAGVLANGAVSSRTLSSAAADYAAGRSELPLNGVGLWARNGIPLFGTGTATTRSSQLPWLPRLALSTGHLQVTPVGLMDGSTIQAALPLAIGRRRAVVDFYFSRAGVQRNLGSAVRHLYVVTGIGALLLYVAILPLIIRVAGAVPLRSDPETRAALAEFDRAISQGELVVHYQPKTALRGGAVVGVEALVRWNHPLRGLLGPAEFLPLAESRQELMTRLTAHVLDRALCDCGRWQRSGRHISVAVNVAASTMLDGPLVQLVRETLERYGLEPRLLTLELTESELMRPGGDLLSPLAELRSMGVEISMDDFGTGHSSLARLRSLPLDELKVDRSFITEIATVERDCEIARHIVALGTRLGLRVVAEGVEDQATLERLAGIGCSAAQGFYLSRPLPEHQLRAWLDAREAEEPGLVPSSAAETSGSGGEPPV